MGRPPSPYSDVGGAAAPSVLIFLWLRFAFFLSFFSFFSLALVLASTRASSSSMLTPTGLRSLLCFSSEDRDSRTSVTAALCLHSNV